LLLLLLLLLPLVLLLVPPGIKGCVPGTARAPGGLLRACKPYNNSTQFETTPGVISVVGAQNNDVGLLGVLPNANVYV
jgi:hypothetical protein